MINENCQSKLLISLGAIIGSYHTRLSMSSRWCRRHRLRILQSPNFVRIIETASQSHAPHAFASSCYRRRRSRNFIVVIPPAISTTAARARIVVHTTIAIFAIFVPPAAATAARPVAPACRAILPTIRAPDGSSRGRPAALTAAKARRRRRSMARRGSMTRRR